VYVCTHTFLLAVYYNGIDYPHVIVRSRLSYSHREKVHVKVEDVNEFAPRWKEDFYSGFVEEGKLNDEILKVEASDADGSTVYSNICNYHIVTDGVPFEINDRGRCLHCQFVCHFTLVKLVLLLIYYSNNNYYYRHHCY